MGLKKDNVEFVDYLREMIKNLQDLQAEDKKWLRGNHDATLAHQVIERRIKISAALNLLHLHRGWAPEHYPQNKKSSRFGAYKVQEQMVLIREDFLDEQGTTFDLSDDAVVYQLIAN